MFGYRPHRPARRRARLSGTADVLESRVLLSGNPLNAGPLAIDPTQYDASSILVRFKPQGDPAGAAHAAVELPVADRLGEEFAIAPGLRKVYLAEGVSVVDALAAYRAHPSVLYAEPNYRVSIASAPSDPQFGSLWGLNNTGQTGGTADSDIDALEAWSLTMGSGQTTVAVLDTGVDYLHEDLAANMWVNAGEIAGDGIDNDGNGFVDDVHGYDFVNNDGSPLDDHGHGTHVSGTIGAAGNNGIGITGVNWNVQIMALKFLDASGSGELADAVAALDYAVANGARISNNSWGANEEFSQALYDTVSRARDAGHIFVAASGNGNFLGIGQDNDTTPFWPSNIDLDNVVAVAATDHNDNLAVFSNYGATTVDLAAPGVDILSTLPNNSYGTSSGTSMAAPHVAGAIALLWDHFPELTYYEVIDRVFESVDPIIGLQGKTVTGGRLNVDAALALGITGPRIMFSSPSGSGMWPVSSYRVRFNEPMDAATFTVDDIVSFTGPDGPISVTGVDVVAGTDSREFEISFETQRGFGTYEIVLGPDIADLSGELMDQDRDEAGGESLDDRFTGTFTIDPFSAAFDFGTSSSPVAAGYTQVTPATSYSSTAGYGWTGGSISAADRPSGTVLTRDLNFGGDMSFSVDVPEGAYEITLLIGDTAGYAHDQMAVSIEGVQVDVVNTAAQQVLTRTYQASIHDGQLNLRLKDLGGVDVNAVINGLELLLLGSDTGGPRIVATSPSPTATGSVDRIALTFSEAIDPATFTLADVVALNGPGGPITPLAINQVSGSIVEIVFDEQVELGEYTFTVGPNIADLAGNLMDQDQDGVAGEEIDDRFTGTFTLEPLTRKYDFGTSSSPVEPGWQQAANTMTYNAASGFGWQASVLGVQRSAGTALTRDLNFGSDITFLADLPEGVYDVTLTMGDTGGYSHDLMGIYIEGVHVDTVSTAAGQIVTRTYRASVQDGQLTLRLKDLGGSDANAVIAGLEVVLLGEDTAGPRVIEVSPTGTVGGPIDRIMLTFDEPVQDGTFTLEDVVSLTGPNGAIAPTAANKLTASSYEIVFAPQSTGGEYSLTIGPDIRDEAGNLMDQDGDDVGGEEVEDRFTGTFALEPFSAKYDFGTSSSPVEAGWQQVVNTTTYTQSSGFGWLSSVLGVNRFSGTPLTRDLNFGADMTFLADVSDGTYDVTLTMGDTGGYPHDLMGIFIEGVHVETISTAAGEIVTRTYRAGIHDGQLTLRLQDLGGSDANAVVAGLQLVLLGPDVTGPRVVETSPTGPVAGPIDRIALTFDEPVQDGTFTLEDVVSLTGPNGAIAPTAFNRLAAASYEIVFAPQSTVGEYSLTIGPDIRDEAGNLMDQDGDGVGGEEIEDRFTGTFELEPFSAKYDFGISSSAVETGWQQVLNSTTYTMSSGFGWLSSVLGVNRSSGTALTRDLNFGADMTFLADVSDGTYDVTLTMGDSGGYPHDLMGIFIEGVHVDTISTVAGQVIVTTFRVSVSDGQLALQLKDLGGTDANAVINGLELLWVGSTTTSMAAQVDSNEPLPLTDTSPDPISGLRTELIGLLPADVIAWLTLLGEEPVPATALHDAAGERPTVPVVAYDPADAAGTGLDDLFASADLAVELDSL